MYISFYFATEEIPQCPEEGRGNRNYWRRVEIRVSAEIWMAIIGEQRARQLGRFAPTGP